MRILLISDSPTDREQIAAKLPAEMAGYSDPCELLNECCLSLALEQLDTGRPDIILLDFNLPECGDLPALARIQAVSKLPVVVLRENGNTELSEQLILAGVQECLIKRESTEFVTDLARSLHHALLRHRLQMTREQNYRRELWVKDQFLSHISHEMRPPLRTAQQFMTIVLDGLTGTLTASQKEYLGIAQGSLQHVNRMMSDLLDLTRSEAGELPIDRHPLFIEEHIIESIKLLQPDFDRKRIPLRTDIHKDLPFVAADAYRIRQVLINLLENALKFTPPGGTVTVRATDNKSGFLVVSVTDTGCGIGGENPERVFDRLFPNGEDRRGRGLGLGLYICRELVQRHGGKIGVYSTINRGSTFYFTLPYTQKS